MERLSEELLFALSDPIPSDITGVLLGRMFDTPRATVVIEDYELIRSEEGNLHAAPAAFSELVARWHDRTAELYAVGFLRSQRDPRLCLTETELDCSRCLFPDGDNVFLVIDSGSSSSHTAAFFFWEDYEIRSHAPYLEFTFPVAPNCRQLPRKQKDKPKVETGAPSSTRPGLLWRRRKPMWSGVATAAALLLVLFAYFRLKVSQASAAGVVHYPARPVQAPPQNTPSGPFDLRAHRNGQLLEIAWRKDSPALAAADRATLTILDGITTRQILLTNSQLRDGHIYYVSAGPSVAPQEDIDLLLEVVQASGKSVSESTGRLADPILRRALAEPTADIAHAENRQTKMP